MKNLIEVHNQLKALTAAVGELIGTNQEYKNRPHTDLENLNVDVAATYPQMQPNCHIDEKGQLVFGSSNPINLMSNIPPETKGSQPVYLLHFVQCEDMTLPYDFSIYIRGDKMLMVGDLVHHIINAAGVGLAVSGVPYVDVCSGKVSEELIHLRSLAIGLLGNRDKLKNRVIDQVLLERLLTDAMNSETTAFNGILAVAGLKRNDINNGNTVPGVVFMGSENLSNCCLFLVDDIMQVSHLLANASNVNKIKHLAIV